MAKIIKLSILILFFIGCKNNPFYPMADIRVTIPNPTVTLEYTIEEEQGEMKITLNYPLLTLIFKEIYGGTYANIESVRVEYFNPGKPNDVIDSLINTLSPYTAGFPLYIPPNEEIEANFNVVNDEVENLFAPPGGFEKPLGVLLKFYGKDGNNYKFEIKSPVIIQRIIAGG